MKLLAFDTATEALAVGLCHGARSWVFDGEGGPKASAELLPRIQALLREAGLALADLDAIAFGRGPGAFTGLRTACSVAQGLALGAARPVLAIDSLLLVAESVRAGAVEFDVDVAMDARMGEVYAGRYAHGGGHANATWRVVREPALLSLPAMNAVWQLEPPRAVAGSALAAFGSSLVFGAASALANPTGRAAALLRCAQAAWAAGAAVDAALALPLYLRDKVAQTTAERALAKAQKA